MFITADTANPNRAANLLRRVDLLINNRSLFNFGEAHNFLCGKIFITERRMRRQINRAIGFDEVANLIERVAGGRQIFKGNGDFILQQCLIGIGNVAVNYIEFVAVLNDND